jgi:hypothetical protein
VRCWTYHFFSPILKYFYTQAALSKTKRASEKGRSTGCSIFGAHGAAARTERAAAAAQPMPNSCANAQRDQKRKELAPPRQLPWCEQFGPASKVPLIFLFSNGGFNLGASCGGKILA